MIGVRTLALLCLVCFAFAGLPKSLRDTVDIRCPDQNENSTVVTIANPDDCSTFYECDNGKVQLLHCAKDTFFSSKEHVCTFRKDSDCPNSESFFSFSLDDGDNTTDPSFSCPADEDNTTSVYYPNLNNCSTFYECSNGRAILLSCPIREYFNAKYCVCTLPKNSGCTQPDDGDDDGFVAFEDNVADISDDEWLEIRAHLERVYSGKCYKNNS